MEPGLAARRGELRGRFEGLAAARPLVRPAPRSAMFFPLVVLVAVLPGLYALNNWDLTPPGPWWGLRALAVLDGMTFDQVPAVADVGPPHEARAFRTVALQPPLYAWLEASGLLLSHNRDPRATVLPSYVAGALVVVLVYLHGRLWRGPGVGLIAAVLTGFNCHLLVQMQQATPTTLALAGALTVLLAYGEHRRAAADSSRRRAWNVAAWTALGGLGLAVSLLSMGLFGLLALVPILLHQAYLRAGSPPAERADPWWRSGLENPSLRAGFAALVFALALALPWHVMMYGRHGAEFLEALAAPFAAPGRVRNLLARLIDLAPATAPLALFAAFRAVRSALADDTDDRAIVGGVFWVVWLATAAVAPALWPSGPTAALNLFLLLPLNLLAAQGMSDLACRRVSVRALTWLAPATAGSVVWWHSLTLQGAVSDLFHGRASSATALGVHLALDLLVAAVWCTRGLDHWARRRDDRQRRVLGVFLVVVLASTIVTGAKEVWFRHKETNALLMLRTMVMRRDRERPFDLVAVVGPDLPAKRDGEPVVPGGRLRFILRSALPRLRQRDLADSDDLLTLPDCQRLVILAGAAKRPSYATQSGLGLEAIHPGDPGTLEAFATAHDPTRPGRR